jgi:hypothetical protein
MTCSYVGFSNALWCGLLNTLNFLMYHTLQYVLGADYAEDTENLGPGEDYQ